MIGVEEALFRLAAKAGLVRKACMLDIYFQRLPSTFFSGSDAPNDFVFRAISREDYHRMNIAEGMPAKDVFDDKFKQGSRLFGLILNGELVAVDWIDERSAYLGSIGMPALTLYQGQAYLHGSFVAPSIRRKGAGSLLKKYLLAYLTEQGFEEALLAIYSNPSIAAWHRQNGFKRWGRICYGKFLDQDRWVVQKTKNASQSKGIIL